MLLARCGIVPAVCNIWRFEVVAELVAARSFAAAKATEGLEPNIKLLMILTIFEFELIQAAELIIDYRYSTAENGRMGTKITLCLPQFPSFSCLSSPFYSHPSTIVIHWKFRIFEFPRKFPHFWLGHFWQVAVTFLSWVLWTVPLTRSFLFFAEAPLVIQPPSDKTR